MSSKFTCKPCPFHQQKQTEKEKTNNISETPSSTKWFPPYLLNFCNMQPKKNKRKLADGLVRKSLLQNGEWIYFNGKIRIKLGFLPSTSWPSAELASAWPGGGMAACGTSKGSSGKRKRWCLFFGEGDQRNKSQKVGTKQKSGDDVICEYFQIGDVFFFVGCFLWASEDLKFLKDELWKDEWIFVKSRWMT